MANIPVANCANSVLGLPVISAFQLPIIPRNLGYFLGVFNKINTRHWSRVAGDTTKRFRERSLVVRGVIF